MIKQSTLLSRRYSIFFEISLEVRAFNHQKALIVDIVLKLLLSKLYEGAVSSTGGGSDFFQGGHSGGPNLRVYFYNNTSVSMYLKT